MCIRWCRRSRHALAGALCGLLTLVAHAEPIVPSGDSQVVEVLPTPSSGKGEERELRRRLAADPTDTQAALVLARRYIARARVAGDPRLAGRALAVLVHWPDARTAPIDIVLTQANIQQYLHDFDASRRSLQRLLERVPRHAQAWLTLATIERVQGRLVPSDAACRQVGNAGALLYAEACLAENAGLRGQFDSARVAFQRLLAASLRDPSVRSWLQTSVAELEARAARPAQAEAAYRRAIEAQPDEYTRLSFADFLLQQRRDTDALAVLQNEPRTDSILLRRAMIGARTRLPALAGDIAEMRERMAQAALRPGSTHAREQSMFALWVDGDPTRALALAKENVHNQRESIDVLQLAQAARAVGTEEALQFARQVRSEMGLRDERVDALL